MYLGLEVVHDLAEQRAHEQRHSGQAPPQHDQRTRGEDGEHYCPRRSSCGRSRNGSKDAVGSGRADWTRWNIMSNRSWLGGTPQDGMSGVGRVPFAS